MRWGSCPAGLKIFWRRNGKKSLPRTRRQANWTSWARPPTVHLNRANAARYEAFYQPGILATLRPSAAGNPTAGSKRFRIAETKPASFLVAIEKSGDLLDGAGGDPLSGGCQRTHGGIGVVLDRSPFGI